MTTKIKSKEDILKKITKMNKPFCPYCKIKMKIWEVPPVNFGDGLGWGTPFLFMCFNDKCNLYKDGWNSIRKNYSHTASYRCINFPGTSQFELIPVFSPIGATGQILEENEIIEQNILNNNIKKGFSVLTDCYVKRDEFSILKILMDIHEPIKVRIKAAEMLGDIASVEIVNLIITLKNNKTKIGKTINKTLLKLFNKFNITQCQHCSKITDNKLKYCKYCKGKIIKNYKKNTI